MHLLEDIPQPLYKYRVWEEPCKEKQFSRRILTENEVYLASSDQFNDPFDGTLPFKYPKADLKPENIFLKLHELGRKENPDMPEEELQRICYERQFSGAFETGDYWKSFYPKFKEELNNTFGILSLSSKRDNLLMWSHYSDSHRGFCVGLDKFLLFKHCAGQLGPVIYSDKFPEIPMFEKSPLGLSALTTTKSLHWKYEDEFRIVKIYGARKIVTLPNEAILEIILGCKMPESHKNNIYEIAKLKFPNAKIFETQINNEEFKIDFLPIFNRQTN